MNRIKITLLQGLLRSRAWENRIGVVASIGGGWYRAVNGNNRAAA